MPFQQDDASVVSLIASTNATPTERTHHEPHIPQATHRLRNVGRNRFNLHRDARGVRAGAIGRIGDSGAERRRRDQRQRTGLSRPPGSIPGAAQASVATRSAFLRRLRSITVVPPTSLERGPQARLLFATPARSAARRSQRCRIHSSCKELMMKNPKIANRIAAPTLAAAVAAATLMFAGT